DRQQLPLSYLEQLVSPLIAGGIIRSTKGPGGGISLNRPPENIKLSDVIRLLEGSIAPVHCIDDPDSCDRSDSCVTRDIWAEMKTVLDSYLDSTTLQDLVQRQKDKKHPGNDLCEI
ncbi:RrF2 family transcriptional regulator, partial [Chloroflexota bacterium]